MSSATVPEATAPQREACLDDDFGWALGVAFRAYLRAADDVLADVPGGPRGYQVLSAAVQGVSGGQGVLAQRLGVDRTVMTYLVDDLEDAGLVERRPDPADRRNKQIAATEQGRHAWGELRRGLQRAEAHVLAPLDDDDRADFRQLLQRIAVRVDSIDPVDNACEIVEEVDPEAAAAHPPPTRSRRRR